MNETQPETATQPATTTPSQATTTMASQPATATASQPTTATESQPTSRTGRDETRDAEPQNSERNRELNPKVVESLTRAFTVPISHIVIALSVVFAVTVISSSVGAAGLPVRGVAAALIDVIPGLNTSSFLGPDEILSERQISILFSIRLPRTVLGLCVGAALAMAGSAYQGVFRNSLADPYLLGISAGAGLGAVLAIGFDLEIGVGPISAVTAAAFLGALLAVSLSILIARGSWSKPSTLLLAGIAMGSIFSAAQTFALQRLNETRAREVLSWVFGQLNTTGWSHVGLLAPHVVICAIILTLHGRHLDVLKLGDDEAKSLGLNPTRTRMVVIITACLLTAAAVSVSGLISFVGLVIPHTVRILFGRSYRSLIPISALFGGAFLASVDVGARTLVAPAELPVGVITALLGSPVFALILWQNRDTL